MIPFNWCHTQTNIKELEEMTYSSYNGWDKLFIVDMGEDWWNELCFKNNSNWLKFKSQLQDNEELWLFKSPPIATTQIKGIAAVNNKNVMRYIII